MKKFNIFINFLFRVLMYFDDIQMTLKKVYKSGKPR